MTVKTMLLVQTEVLVVVVIVALFVWRYWYEPRQQTQQLMPAPAEVQAPAAPVTSAPVVPPKPQPAPAVATPAATAPAPAPKAKPAAAPVAKPALLSMVKNGDFAKGLQGWSYWKDARVSSNLISVVRHDDKYRTTHVLQIENPDKKMMGVQQPVALVSGTIYRLSAKVRSTATIDSSVIFGGRVALYLPPQAEQAIVWVTENTNWWGRTLEFTNTVTGVGALYVHMGYGSVASTGEFAGVALEKVHDLD
ncbi:MAG: hypothetical protein NTV22_08135 [bacterium]|nr:hypothetical protein [bacterium]